MKVFLVTDTSVLIFNSHISSWTDVKEPHLDELRIIRISLIQKNNTEQRCQLAGSFLLDNCTFSEEIEIVSFSKSTRHLKALIDTPS